MPCLPNLSIGSDRYPFEHPRVHYVPGSFFTPMTVRTNRVRQLSIIACHGGEA